MFIGKIECFNGCRRTGVCPPGVPEREAEITTNTEHKSPFLVLPQLSIVALCRLSFKFYSQLGEGEMELEGWGEGDRVSSCTGEQLLVFIVHRVVSCQGLHCCEGAGDWNDQYSDFE